MPIEKTVLHEVPLGALVPYDRNPRKNDPAVPGVMDSLDTYGYVKISIVVDEDMVLIAGHTTLKAAQQLGWSRIPEVLQVVGLSEAQKKAYRIADNRTGERATWDTDLLLGELSDLADMEFNLDLTGFDEAVREDLFGEPAFDPIPEDATPRLDEKKKVICPECGHEFTP